MEVLANSMALLNQSEEARQRADNMRQLIDAHLVEEAIAKKEVMLRKVRALFRNQPYAGSSRCTSRNHLSGDICHADQGSA